MEEKVFGRFEGEHSQRQKYLGEFRVNVTLSHVRRWGRRERKTGKVKGR